MDLGLLGDVSLDLGFVSGLLSIVLINLILSGDNAVVIALAVRSLPRGQRRKGIILGSAIAILLRVVLTFFAAQLLQVRFLKLVGGAMIAWLAVKLFLGDSGSQGLTKEAGSFGQAVRIILVSDLIMSLDNVLAVAAASKGDIVLLIFGLAMSIPIVVGTSTLLSRLMDRHPVIIYIGAALLGKVAGEMIITDPFMVGTFEPGTFVRYGAEVFFAVGVIVAGKLCLRSRTRREEAALTPDAATRGE